MVQIELAEAGKLKMTNKKVISYGFLWWALLFILAAIFPQVTAKFYVYMVNEIFIMALFALSLNFLLGSAGMVSFGQAAYYGIGAYTVALFITKSTVPVWLALIASPVFSALAALIIGFFCVRLTHIYFAMLTMAFGQIVYAIAFKWYSFTGGDNGIVGLNIPELLSTPVNFYYFTLILLAFSMIVLKKIVSSPFGCMLRALRENPERTEFIGINVKNFQLIAFIIAGFFSGLAGALSALFTRSAFPDFIYWTKSAEGLIMALLGGIYTFIGPAIGAGILLILDKWITSYTEYWPFFLGVVLIILLYFFPGGVIGFIIEKFQKAENRIG